VIFPRHSYLSTIKEEFFYGIYPQEHKLGSKYCKDIAAGKIPITTFESQNPSFDNNMEKTLSRSLLRIVIAVHKISSRLREKRCSIVIPHYRQRDNQSINPKPTRKCHLKTQIHSANINWTTYTTFQLNNLV
jgi:hypothetical protein